MTKTAYHRLGLFVVAVLAFAALSPKWLLSPLAWIAPALLLVLIAQFKPLKGFFLAWAVLFLAGLIGNYKVFPFPLLVSAVLTLLISLTNSLPYVFAVWLTRLFPSWTSVAFFPALAVSIEYLNSFSGGGSLGSLAYTQAEHTALIQLASVTGIWGISFLLYLSSSIIFWVVTMRGTAGDFRKPIGAFAVLLSTVLLYGEVRTSPFLKKPQATIKVAGITDLNLEPILTMYRETFNKTMVVDPQGLTQTSPELEELNKALVQFVERPLDPKYAGSLRAMDAFHERMFQRAQQEVNGGAELIVFSEALMFTIKPLEDSLITKGRKFARANDVKILLTMGSFLPGKITMGAKWIENKAILINEGGEVVYTFLKNKPVPVVEGSVPGDGHIPVAQTAQGRIATSICYDADFPALMRQAGRQKADVLLLPSGDWREISPLHADVARFRAIENGFSLVRPVSGAESIICDQFGRVIARGDFLDEGSRSISASLPVRHVWTLYPRLGDWFAVLCVTVGFVAALLGLIKLLRSKSRRHVVS